LGRNPKPNWTLLFARVGHGFEKSNNGQEIIIGKRRLE